MNTIQKIIKMLAIAFAIFLIVMIFSTIVRVGMAITGYFVPGRENIAISKELNLDNISNIDIDLEYANLNIKSGKKLSVNVDTDDIKITTDDNVLKIVEKKIRNCLKMKKELLLYIYPMI